MALTSGMKLGRYEILSSLGAGGMGEVYRARDSRLDRFVAVKILPAALSADADRLKRFEGEARILSALNHPNLLAIYDVGVQEDIHYLVSELLEGQSLREKMSGGPLPQRRVVEYALEMAKGLAAAHEKGIVHRDLKPDNIFLNKDGRVKILDFGLAKQSSQSGAAEVTEALGAPTPTTPGTVMGTVGYMSPEQVRAQVVDHRSDLFSFGAILYEMISGKRAFKGQSSVETMNAILKEDPPELSDSSLKALSGLDRVVRHCLEKEPDLRFQSARDLAFDLESLSSTSSSVSAVSAARVAHAGRRSLLWPAAALVVMMAFAAGLLLHHLQARAQLPRFQQITFRRGTISDARLAPDGQTIIYGAAWEGNPKDLYSGRTDGPGERPLGMPDT